MPWESHGSEGIRRAWDRIAPGYDRTNTPTQMWLGNAGLRRAGLRAGTTFLDVAAGSGALGIPAARLGARVHAVDRSVRMLELLDRMVRDRAGGRRTAKLATPINIGIGTKWISLAREDEMSSSEGVVLAHHKAAASMWDQGGRAYDDVSFGLSDALAHAAQRLSAREGEEILDVATGTGWSARNVARSGARVSAVDISSELLAAARDLSAHVHPAIDFQLGDAERLPFPDGRFDGVISTFGVIFAQNQQHAGSELGRILSKGGRLVLATWAPDGSVAKFLGVIARHNSAPPPPVSPLAWGNPRHVEKLLGRDFELKFEHGVNNAYHPDTGHIWEKYAHGFGPMRQLIAGLQHEQLAALRADVDAYHRQYETDCGLHVKREYLIVLGRRR
jgi:ubiquinone/menaquinone biosynthesis C-methylase UbiE